MDGETGSERSQRQKETVSWDSKRKNGGPTGTGDQSAFCRNAIFYFKRISPSQMQTLLGSSWHSNCDAVVLFHFSDEETKVPGGLLTWQLAKKGEEPGVYDSKAPPHPIFPSTTANTMPPSLWVGEGVSGFFCVAHSLDLWRAPLLPFS